MHRTMGSCTVLAAAACAAALAWGAGVAPGTPPAGAPSPAATSRVRATGRGRAPGRARSDAQLRLMAKRAAVVEAYKNATRTLGRSRSTVAGGTGTETVGGFIRGVELVETRYYRGGDVEVDVEFTVPAAPDAPTPPAPDAEVPRGGELLLVEKGGGPMGEEEWRDILGGGGVSRP